MNIGNICKIEIISPNNHKIGLTGIVVWLLLKENKHKKKNKSTYYKAGLKFIELNTSEKAFIESII